MNRARDGLAAAILRRPRTCRRLAIDIERLEPRQLLAGDVPPGMNLAQANWFYQNTFSAPASVAPEWNGDVATGDAGSLGAGYLAAIVARVNAYRWMAGLPGGVTLDATENDEAQQAALMMAANVELEPFAGPELARLLGCRRGWRGAFELDAGSFRHERHRPGHD